MKMLDLIDQRFGRLEVIRKVKGKSKKNSYWYCRCDCGKMVKICRPNLQSGHTRSCGCLSVKSRTKHGKADSPEYKVWVHMLSRCNNEKDQKYKDYGGRGIKVCVSWLTFIGFYKDMGERPTSLHSIERIDNNGNYKLSNCKWATQSEQMHNTRIYKNNTTGIAGVVWHKARRKYRARIRVANKDVHLGYFDTLLAAKDARKQGELMHWKESIL